MKQVLSIAGLDPGGGAGLFADLRVMQELGVSGNGVCTALTFQNTQEFAGVRWVSAADIEKQIDLLLQVSSLAAIKIGLIENLQVLAQVVSYLKTNVPQASVIWDPVLSATAGFEFHRELDEDSLHQILTGITLVTPNAEEAPRLALAVSREQHDAPTAAHILSEYSAVLLKGGHLQGNACTDTLFQKKAITGEFSAPRLQGVNKHGTGCVLSSAIASQMALGKTLAEACRQGRDYLQTYLQIGDEI